MPRKPPNKVFFGIRLDPDLLAGLRQIEQDVGISVAEQMRRAVRTWLEANDIKLKPKPRKAGLR
jgi:hypothetical protein